MDYRGKYKNEAGACASCYHVRSFIQGDIHDGRQLIPYDGGKHATCAVDTSRSIVMSDEPRMDLDVNECWVGEPQRVLPLIGDPQKGQMRLF